MVSRNLPNHLTIFRLLLAPTLLATTLLPGGSSSWAALSILALAGASDYLDGALARKWNILSEFGRMMDPIADKVVVASAIMLLLWQGSAPLVPAAMIFARELLISGLREYLAIAGKALEVSHLAKWKTTLQFTALAILFAADLPILSETQQVVMGLAGSGAFWFTALVTVGTGYDYWLKARSLLGENSAKVDL
mgnify:CR=1 FL=1